MNADSDVVLDEQMLPQHERQRDATSSGCLVGGDQKTKNNENPPTHTQKKKKKHTHTHTHQKRTPLEIKSKNKQAKPPKKRTRKEPPGDHQDMKFSNGAFFCCFCFCCFCFLGFRLFISNGTQWGPFLFFLVGMPW